MTAEKATEKQINYLNSLINDMIESHESREKHECPWGPFSGIGNGSQLAAQQNWSDWSAYLEFWKMQSVNNISKAEASNLIEAIKLGLSGKQFGNPVTVSVFNRIKPDGAEWLSEKAARYLWFWKSKREHLRGREMVSEWIWFCGFTDGLYEN